jgi:hypothetical protein
LGLLLILRAFAVEDYEEAEAFRDRWNELNLDVPLVIIESPYRWLLGPLLDYIDAIDKQDPQRPVTIVLAEFVPRHWWEHLLHNLTPWQLKLHLFTRPNTITIDVPYHVGRGFEHPMTSQQRQEITGK